MVQHASALHTALRHRSSARILLYNPCHRSLQASLQHQLTLILIFKVIDGLHPHDSTDHVPINERVGLLGQCRSLEWRERGKLSILHSRGCTCGPKTQETLGKPKMRIPVEMLAHHALHKGAFWCPGAAL